MIAPRKTIPLEVTRRIDALCDEFEAALARDGQLSLGRYVAAVDEPWQALLIRELAPLALGWLEGQGVAQPLEALVAANPALRADLESAARGHAAATVSHNADATQPKSAALVVRCPHCRNEVELSVDAALLNIVCRTCGGTFSLINEAEHTREAGVLARVAHFELVERLGMGEFGAVWKARDTVLDRTVALKIPRREQLDAAAVEKLLREARAAAQLNHPNIVSTHEVGRHGDTFYIVIDYIDGVSLADFMTARRLSVRESAMLTAKIAAALDYAHRQGIVHRDLKPSNILIDRNEEPYLMDFGLAKRRETEIAVTTEGVVLGTPAYMSPEQARGEAWRADGRSDIYSLGVILFQLLTTELPFRGSLRMLLQRVIHEDAPGPRSLDSNVSRDLDTICLKCLEKDPGRRYASAGDLAADLERYLTNQPVLARRIGPAGRAARWARRNRALAISFVALVLTTAASSYAAWSAAQKAALADQLALQMFSEIRSTREGREPGYGERVRRLVRQVLGLAGDVDRAELRREVVLSLGDFAGQNPRLWPSFNANINTFVADRHAAQLIVGLASGELQICGRPGASPPRKLAKFSHPVTAAALSASGERLLAVDDHGELRTWRRADAGWREEAGFVAGTAAVIGFSPHGDWLACAGDSVLELWDTREGKNVHRLATEPGWTIRNCTFDPAEQQAVAGYHDADADSVGWAMWDLTSGERVIEQRMPSLGNTYRDDIEIASDGKRLAIGFDEALLLYELPNLEPVKLTGFDSTKAIAFSPTGPYLAAANIRGWINVWNPTTGRHLATLKMPGIEIGRTSLAFSDDGMTLIASQANQMWAWDLSEGDEKTTLAGHRGAVPCLAFSPRGLRLASGGKDHEVRLWGASGELLKSADIGEAVQALAFSPDGALLAVGSMGRDEAPHLRILQADSLEVQFAASLRLGDVHSLTWQETADATVLASCGERGVAYWNITGRNPLTQEPDLELQRKNCLAVAVVPHRPWIVWAEEERLIRGWNLRTSQPLEINAPRMHQGWHGLALAPHSDTLVYIDSVGKGQLWDVGKDRSAGVLGEPGTFAAPHLALSPDGAWLAALTQPDRVSVWQRATGDHLFTLRPESGTVWSLAWDATSRHLAIGQSDGGLAVWHLTKLQRELEALGLAWSEVP